MVENTLGTYQCRECDTTFKITATGVTTAYDGWTPECPVCGTDESVVQPDG